MADLRRQAKRARGSALAVSLVLIAAAAAPARALDDFGILLRSDDRVLGRAIQAASLTSQTKDDKKATAQDLYAAAREDYGRILGALYGEGYYSGVIHVLIDGREAASIPPLDAPDSIRSIRITVDPGRPFRFSRAEAGPLAPKTELPEGFAVGERARSGEIVSAAGVGVTGWREAGHAKARIADQQVTADHRTDRLDARLRFDPGPSVVFGDLTITGNKRVRTDRIAKIAGFPTGEPFDPKKAEDVATRLRRTGAFRAVALQESERLGPGNTLDYTLVLDEQKRRRYSAGVEYSTTEGTSVEGYWLHRNLFGGAESLRIDAMVSGIGGETGGEDYELKFRLERPGTPFRDSSAFIAGGFGRLNEDDYTADTATLGIGLTRYITDKLSGEVQLAYEASDVTDDAGDTKYRQLVFPIKLTWDGRDSKTDPAAGLFLSGEVKPFLGFETTENGARLAFDTRAYHGFGAKDRVVLAGRVQGGAILGASLEGTPRDYLFYSGGGGTVRGQPYQSLSVTEIAGNVESGGTKFAALSGEVRASLTKSLGVVAFYDAGYVAGEDQDGWHAGAGLGLRYKTGIGPIRLDVAGPAGGDTGRGMQVYIGLGQAF